MRTYFRADAACAGPDRRYAHCTQGQRFPTQIEQVLLSHPCLTSNYQILVDRQRDQLDELEVRVEVNEVLHGERSETISALQATVAEDLRQALGLHAYELLVEPHHLARSEGKVKCVVNRRQLTG